MPPILVKNLYKTYYIQKFVPPPVKVYRKIRGIKPQLQGVQALKNISFEVNKGEIFGIIGPDGAGKTTLFRILTTLLLPDHHSERSEESPTDTVLQVENYDVIKDFQEIRNISGYMPGKFSLYMDLTVEENLNFFATLFNTTIEENYHLIKDIYQQIEPFKDRKAGALSGGMKQKLALSCALIHKPKVLFLDEPTTGVDPVSRKEFWEMLRRLKEQEITILVSTPYMDEASLCDRIALINKGEFIGIDTPQKIIANFTENLYSIEGDNMYQILLKLRQNQNVKSCFAFGDTLHVTVDEMMRRLDDKMIQYLEDYLVGRGYQNITIKKIKPNIEDCYMKLSQSS
jgi:ABC-type multidrug transport system ATPase subunit